MGSNYIFSLIRAWLDAAESRFKDGTLSRSDFDSLRLILSTREARARQRLLYLHAKEPSIHSEVIAWDEHPAPGGAGDRPDPPYESVFMAMQDGWQVIHFPQQLAPFDDWETDIAGFEFILQKME